MKHLSRNTFEQGQTLIETIVAIFILTMALTSGLTVGIYVLNATSTGQNQIIAASLAREGVEVIRMMRDSNWLAGDATGGDFALTACADIANNLCYPKAYTGPTYNFLVTSQPSRVVFNASTKTWSLDQNTSYNLYLQGDGTYTHTANGNSFFVRKILISANSAAPYSAANPELIIDSIVAWRGKNCPTIINQDPGGVSPAACKIVVEDHLTNWKDYK